MKLFYTVLAVIVLASSVSAASRKLLSVNSLGETLDLIDLEDSSVTLFVDALGLYPNDVQVAGNTGIVINSGSNDLYFYNVSTLQHTGNLFLGSGRNPYVGAFLNLDTFYVTNLVASTVTKVNAVTRSIISEFPVGDGADADSPQGMVIRERRAYVCLSSFNDLFEYDAGKLEVWDCNGDTLIKRVTVGVNPQLARFGYDGYLYILCTGNYSNVEGQLYKFDPQSNLVVDSLFIGGYPGGLAITKQGVAFMAAGGWPPPVAMTAEGRKFVDRRSEFATQRAGGIVFTANLSSFSLLHGPANPLASDWGVTAVMIVSDSTVVSCNFADDTVTEIDSAGVAHARYGVGDGPLAVAKYPACFAIKGDANVSGAITISDAVFLVSYIFGGGAAPAVKGCGDMNCSGGVSISDAVAVVQYIFAGGPGSCGCAD